jgi:hypothetical protein
MEFIETTVFTRRVAELGLEGQLRQLQLELLGNPEAGALDPGTGGLRKVRLADPGRGKGKRGGARVHYLLVRHHERIYFLYVFGKDEAATLTPGQKKQLRAVVERMKRE